MKYQKLSKLALKKGCKRPEVFLLQEAINCIRHQKIAEDGIFGNKTDGIIRELQRSFYLEIDGVVGKSTWTAILEEAYKKGFKPALKRRVQSLVCLYETSRNNAYGFAENDIGDGAGANYGVVQHNAMGSMVTLLKMAGRNDLLNIYNNSDKSKVNSEIHDWFNTFDGIKAQDKYFDRIIWQKAMSIIDDLPALKKNTTESNVGDWKPMNMTELIGSFNTEYEPYYERAVALAADSVVQNGGMFSGNRKPFWKSLTEEEAKVAKYRELYYGTEWDKRVKSWDFKDGFDGSKLVYENFKKLWYGYEERDGRAEANKNCMKYCLEGIKDPQNQLILVAQWRARSSSPRWWRDVEKRRMLDATGDGKVHGYKINLKVDYGIGK